MKANPNRTRVLIENTEGANLRRLINIQPYRKDGELYEYKITLNGFESWGWAFIKGAKIDSRRGFVKSGMKRNLNGSIEIGYHRDGKTAYKDADGNLRPMVKNIPIDKITKPHIFFRIAGFNIESLKSFNKKTGEHDGILELPFHSDTMLTCDFYFSRDIGPGKKYSLQQKDKNSFKNSQFFIFESKTEHLNLHLHFYETELTEGPIAMIIRNDIWGRIGQKFYYAVYKLRGSPIIKKK